MKKKTGKGETQGGLLLTFQQAATCLGLTKRDVQAMVDEGLLHEVRAGEKRRITARSVSHTLGYDPFGVSAPALGGKYTDLTFEQYALKMLNRGVKKAHSRTIENYRSALSLTAKELGGLPMTEIGEEDLRRAFRRIEGKYAKYSLMSAYTITRCVMRTAYEAGDIPSDPSKHLEAPKSTKPRRGDANRVYSQSELAEILRTSREYSAELYTMFALLECTGMRPGEMLALEWDSYDREKRTIRVFQAVTRQFGAIRDLGKSGKSKSVISVPKSEYSVRTLRLSETAVEALDAWRTTLKRCGDRSKARSRYIFPGAKGRFRSLSGAEKLLQQYRAAYDLEGVTFYKFRHTMCTRLALDRQPVSVIQRVLGDNSPDVVTRIYTHVYAEEALRAMDDFFDRNADKPEP